MMNLTFYFWDGMNKLRSCDSCFWLSYYGDGNIPFEWKSLHTKYASWKDALICRKQNVKYDITYDT